MPSSFFGVKGLEKARRGIEVRESPGSIDIKVSGETDDGPFEQSASFPADGRTKVAVADGRVILARDGQEVPAAELPVEVAEVLRLASPFEEPGAWAPLRTPPTKTSSSKGVVPRLSDSSVDAYLMSSPRNEHREPWDASGPSKAVKVRGLPALAAAVAVGAAAGALAVLAIAGFF